MGYGDRPWIRVDSGLIMSKEILEFGWGSVKGPPRGYWYWNWNGNGTGPTKLEIRPGRMIDDESNSSVPYR